MLPLTNPEAAEIGVFIEPQLDLVPGEYDLVKYPIAVYERVRDTFSRLPADNGEIRNALMWKWGHWGKANFPMAQKNLIAEVARHWPAFAVVHHATAEDSFRWWERALHRPTTYITEAFITHLVHFMEPLPIIDQHNFRAMNHLVRSVRPSHDFKLKPSQWKDIADLKVFMTSVLSFLINRNFDDLDRFLMMYGKSHVPRNRGPRSAQARAADGRA